MKCAYITTLLEQDGVPFGIELSWGRRTQHERGIDRLVESLALRRQADGQLMACTRRLAQRLFFARGVLNGEDQAVLELVPEYDAKAPAPSLRTLRRHVDAFERLWSPLEDEQFFRQRPVRGAWDESTFVVHVRGSANADALELLGGAFAAEDLSVTYGPAPSALLLGPSESDLPAPGGPCLGLFAPGLCPPAWRRVLAQASLSQSIGRIH